jgi:hypothetical protein
MKGPLQWYRTACFYWLYNDARFFVNFMYKLYNDAGSSAVAVWYYMVSVMYCELEMIGCGASLKLLLQLVPNWSIR